MTRPAVTMRDDLVLALITELGTATVRELVNVIAARMPELSLSLNLVQGCVIRLDDRGLLHGQPADTLRSERRAKNQWDHGNAIVWRRLVPPIDMSDYERQFTDAPPPH